MLYVEDKATVNWHDKKCNFRVEWDSLLIWTGKILNKHIYVKSEIICSW